MALNTINRRPVQIDNEELPYTDRFSYLGSIISRDGGADLEIQSRLRNSARNSLFFEAFKKDLRTSPKNRML